MPSGYDLYTDAWDSYFCMAWWIMPVVPRTKLTYGSSEVLA